MGNQHNFCKNDTSQDTSLPPPTIQKSTPAATLPQPLKTLQTFVDQNLEFFANDGLAIVHALLSEPNNDEIINKFPLEKTTENFKIFLPAQTKDEFSKYQGDCILLNYQKTQIYIGSMKYGIKSGKGILINIHGNKYEGEWTRDLRNGYGKYEILYPKRVYEGNWENGKMEGEGSAIYEDGAKYEGEFSQGKKHGKGRLTFKDGAVYEGRFENDLMNGFGTFRNSNGREISGEWKDGKRVIHKAERSSGTFTINSETTFREYKGLALQA